MNLTDPAVLLIALSRVPLWVPALFVSLVALGVVLRRPRTTTPRAQAVVATLMAAYSLAGVVSGFDGEPLPATAWLAGALAAAALGTGPLAPRGFEARDGGRRVYMPGGWLPLGLLLGIFTVRFGLGFAAGAGMPVVPDSAVAAGAAFSLGLLSGGFAARALTVRRVASAGVSFRQGPAVAP